jgi:DnaJ-class molecular chaperone
MFCTKCNGTGQCLGNGMMITDCNKCDGYGTISLVVAKPIAVESIPTVKATNVSGFIDKRGRHYRDAIKDIMMNSPGTSRDEAMKLFDNACAKNS